MVQYSEDFEKRVAGTIRKHKLLKRRERVLVACSGGKDSTTVLYLLGKMGYDAEAMIIDLLMGDWSEKNLKNTRTFCSDHEIKLHVVDMRKEFGGSMCYVRSVIQEKTKLSNCSICGVMKRWMLNKKARELGFKRIATGHNLDDEAETILMNLMLGNPSIRSNSGPTTGHAGKGFVERIKPLYFLTNSEIRRYSELQGFPVLYKPCPCSYGTFRRDVRSGIARLEKHEPSVKRNIVDSSLAIKGMIKTKAKSNELRACSGCGEPSRNIICKRCKLIGIMRGEHG